MHRRRNIARWSVLIGGAFLAVLGGTAFACTNLATLNLSASVGRPGDSIMVTGTSFLANIDDMPMDGMEMDMSAGGMSMMDVPARSPVVVRWDGPEGPILADAIPDKGGTIAVLIDIPQTRPGHYTLVAVQKNRHGYDVYGTPARAPIQVVGPGQGAGNDARGGGAAGGSGLPTSPGAIALTLGLGVLGVGLVAASATVAVRQVRVRRGAPARVDANRD